MNGTVEHGSGRRTSDFVCSSLVTCHSSLLLERGWRRRTADLKNRSARRSLFWLTLNARRNRLQVVIKSFRGDETERLFHREPRRKFRAIERSALRKLDMLDASNDLRILGALPGNRLERLRGDRQGQYSIRINDQWRVCFTWREGDAYHVEITDYH